MALNTDYAMRTGPFDHKGQGPTEEKEGKIRQERKRKFDLFYYIYIYIYIYIIFQI
jgi:hypothetical protein